MADSPPTPDANRSARVRHKRGSTTPVPRWEKVFVIVFIALAVLFVILHLTGNGFGAHMHMSALEHAVGQR
jgi:hypothetical protein